MTSLCASCRYAGPRSKRFRGVNRARAAVCHVPAAVSLRGSTPGCVTITPPERRSPARPSHYGRSSSCGTGLAPFEVDVAACQRRAQDLAAEDTSHGDQRSGPASARSTERSGSAVGVHAPGVAGSAGRDDRGHGGTPQGRRAPRQRRSTGEGSSIGIGAPRAVARCSKLVSGRLISRAQRTAGTLRWRIPGRTSREPLAADRTDCGNHASRRSIRRAESLVLDCICPLRSCVPAALGSGSQGCGLPRRAVAA